MLQLLNYRKGRSTWTAFVEGDMLYPLLKAKGGSGGTGGIVSADRGTVEQLAEQARSSTPVDISSVNVLPCVLHPGKIICVGHNYRSHVEERRADMPSEPVIFGKFPDTLAAHMDNIPIPKYAANIDYEAELGFVVGRECFDISPSEASEYIFGYFPANDVSARDLQFRSSQWILGKNCERFCPIGPALTVAGDFDPHTLSIECRVNGELRQQSNTSMMIFNCFDILSYVSRYMRMHPGDIVLTGTPGGVILGMEESKRVWLRKGDRVDVSIEGLGTLSNTFS